MLQFLSEFGILFGQYCAMYPLDPNYQGDRHIFDSKDGSLLVGDKENPIAFDFMDYCVDYTKDMLEGIVSQYTYVCFEYFSYVFYGYSLGLCVSSLFLVITIILYGCSPKVSDLLKSSKTLICHNKHYNFLCSF